MADVVVFGAGDAAQLAKFYFERFGEHRVVGFTVDADRVQAASYEGLPVVAWEDLEERFPPEAVRLFAPIGYAKLNAVRKARFNDGRARGYRFATFIHPNASYYGTPVGENCMILEPSYINPFSEIGDNVMFWGGVIGHHVRVADHCFLTRAIVMAHASLGERCFVSFSDVLDHVTIGEACVIARRAYVTEDLPSNCVVVGPPSVRLKIPSGRLRL